jgi:hypothetical protein
VTQNPVVNDKGKSLLYSAALSCSRYSLDIGSEAESGAAIANRIQGKRLAILFPRSRRYVNDARSSRYSND